MSEVAVVEIAPLEAAGLHWANRCYAAVDFLPSTGEDFIAVAHVDGERAALARVTTISTDEGELGGMYVLPRFRGAGLSRQLISYLVEHCRPGTLYCLPFEQLRALYADMGFVECPVDETVPEPVRSKHAWCNRHYRQPVLLMKRMSERSR